MRSLLPAIALVALGGSLIGAGGLRGCGGAPAPPPAATPTPAPPAPPPPPSIPIPPPGCEPPSEADSWRGVAGDVREQTRGAVRAAQGAIGDTCGVAPRTVLAELVEKLLASGACAGLMGEGDEGPDAVFVRRRGAADVFEQWHPVHFAAASRGCQVAGPVKAVWERTAVRR
jgi:hypothetical protein